MLKISGVTKTFNAGTINEKKALNGIDLHLKPKDFVTIIGGNGAGKSTTISILCGQLKKDAGTVVIGGRTLEHNTDQIKRDLGVVFQDCVLDKALTVYENLESRAALYGITGKTFKERLDELAKLLDFEDILKTNISYLSK